MSRHTPDIAAEVCRRCGITRPGFDPECIHAAPLVRDKSLLRCVLHEHDPLLVSDCRGCEAWEPPDNEEEPPA